jgi:hypothetical protein
LALFGRRPPERVERFVIAGSRKPAQKLTHAPQQNDAHELAYSITSSHRLLL